MTAVFGLAAVMPLLVLAFPVTTAWIGPVRHEPVVTVYALLLAVPSLTGYIALQSPFLAVDWRRLSTAIRSVLVGALLIWLSFIG